MAEYLDFKEISKVPFKSVLDWQNVPYKEENGKIIGENFIIDVHKNLYFNPNGEGKGSPINFLSNVTGVALHEAASMIKREFLIKKNPTKIPELELSYPLLFQERNIPEALAIEFECGYCKKGIMAGRIAFKVMDENGVKVAYVGYKLADDSWLFPKNFKREVVYNLHHVSDTKAIVVNSPLDVIQLANIGHKNAVALFPPSPLKIRLNFLNALNNYCLLGWIKQLL